MLEMDAADEQRMWKGMRRVVAAPQGPTIAGAGLATLAALEAVVRAATTGVTVRGAMVLCVLALATTVPLALLGSVSAATAITASTTVSLALFETLTIAGAVAQVVALVAAGHRSARPATVLLALPFAALAFTSPRGFEAGVLTTLLAILAPTAALSGMTARARRETHDLRVTRQAITGALREHTARGERARISRELHDVVAHHISMIAVEAETARLTTPGLPAAGAQRLSSIGETARAALTEMRRMLGVLRDGADPEPAERHPQPDLRQLNELLDAVRDASGTTARLIISGPAATLDPGVEVAAYRIVQEALTNARRHAAGAAVDVELRYRGDGSLLLSIRDNGPGPDDRAAASGDGHGLRGMHERATAVGGRVRTGRATGGGFLVTADLPGTVEENE